MVDEFLCTSSNTIDWKWYNIDSLNGDHYCHTNTAFFLDISLFVKYYWKLSQSMWVVGRRVTITLVQNLGPHEYLHQNYSLCTNCTSSKIFTSPPSIVCKIGGTPVHESMGPQLKYCLFPPYLKYPALLRFFYSWN